jgi:O-antigen ligase
MAGEDMFGDVGGGRLGRLGGFAYGGIGFFVFLLLRYGVRGMLDIRKPWRMGAAALIFVAGLYGGYRSVLVLYVMLVGLQFWIEGLWRTRLFGVVALVGVLSVLLLIPFGRHLPLSVQRTLSVLPIEIDPVARADAEASTQWRLKMWQVLRLDIPKYFWLGKGYTASATDYYLAAESTRRGLADDIETSMLAGDYHSGPLSLILPFGIWGVLGFSAFLIAGLRVLYNNYRYGLPELRMINSVLLSYFIARIFFFFFVFATIDSDMAVFCGLAALSVSLNGGMRKETDLAPSAEPVPA